MNEDIIHETRNSLKTFQGYSYVALKGTEEIPKGRRLKQYLQYGIVNVVNWADFLDKGTYQSLSLCLAW